MISGGDFAAGLRRSVIYSVLIWPTYFVILPPSVFLFM